MENQTIQRGRHVVILHLGERRFIHPTREKTVEEKRVERTDLNYWIKHPFEFSDPNFEARIFIVK